MCITRFKATLLALILSVFSSLSFAGHPVNINTADAADIADALDGIGLKKAQAIVAYREKMGPFASKEGITNVKGIGAKTLEKNADYILLTSN